MDRHRSASGVLDRGALHWTDCRLVDAGRHALALLPSSKPEAAQQETGQNL